MLPHIPSTIGPMDSCAFGQSGHWHTPGSAKPCLLDLLGGGSRVATNFWKALFALRVFEAISRPDYLNAYYIFDKLRLARTQRS